jgi:glycosyltransferase involved in cell wall biosynthesis
MRPHPDRERGNEAVMMSNDNRSTDRPTLSIVIPAYNVADYIEAAISSALDQTFRDLEVIVVEDGSTDQTPAVIEALGRRRKDQRLRIVSKANGGLAAARNTGIAEAKGAFVGFLDGDDIWMPEKAEKHLLSMQKDPSIGISFSNSAYLTEDGQRTGTFLIAGKSNPSLHDMIRRNHVGNGSSPIVRRACFEIAGIFHPDLRSCEDYEMWCRILRSGFRASGLDDPLTLYRLRTTSLSFNFEKFLENADRAMSYLKTAMPNVPRSVFRAGHAEHYRIAAWKAVSSSQTSSARKLLMKAVRLRPGLMLSDWRAFATAVALVIPAPLRDRSTVAAKVLRHRLTRRHWRRGPISDPNILGRQRQ